MELDEVFKSSIRLAMEDDSLDLLETFEAAVRLYVVATGEPFDVEDEEWFISFFHQCQKFILDEVLSSLILKGAVEVQGMEEDGDFVYGLTESGKGYF